MTDTAIAELALKVGVRDACQAVGVAQAGYYRRHARARHRSGRRRCRTETGRSRER